MMGSWWQHIKASRSLLLALLTPVICLPLPLLVDGTESRCAYTVIVMGVLWVTETVPLAVTALLPVVLFPLMGIMSTKDANKAFMADTVMMMLGALQVAIGVEVWNLHKRIALRVLLMVGSEPRWVMLGMMLSTWFLSMWISNTATTAMMIPITEAILQQLQTTNVSADDTKAMENGATRTMEMTKINQSDQPVIENGEGPEENRTAVKQESVNKQPTKNEEGNTDPHYKRLCTGMSLSICYAANCGGIATLTGTGPNLIVKGFAEELYSKYGETSPINFARWMGFGMPLSILMLLVCWVWLQIAFLRCRGACSTCRKSGTEDSNVAKRVKTIIRSEYDSLGPMTFAEGSMLFWFTMMVVLWVTRDLGGVGGWQDVFKEKYLTGTTVSLTIAFILYFYPSTPPAIFTGRRMAERHSSDENYVGVQKLRPLLKWKEVQQKLPWGLLLLLGGGFTLAKGCEVSLDVIAAFCVITDKVSGLSQWIGDQLKVFSYLDSWEMAFILCYITAATTEVTSNSAIATLFMPILSSLALATGVHPLYYLIAGSSACSFAYMLPVATPPNAIVFSYGRVRIKHMMAAGIVLNVLAVPLLVAVLGTAGNAVFDLQNPPDFFFPNATGPVSFQ